jgi:hypothetical protein
VSNDLWRVEGDFRVSRRIPWETDDTLRPHIDQVVDTLRAAEASVEIEVDADLESARVLLSLTVVGDREEDRDAIARETIARAIRECGGRHEGLLRLIDESRLERRSGPWSGLRTPNWALFHLTSEPVSAD